MKCKNLNVSSNINIKNTMYLVICTSVETWVIFLSIRSYHLGIYMSWITYCLTGTLSGDLQVLDNLLSDRYNIYLSACCLMIFMSLITCCLTGKLSNYLPAVGQVHYLMIYMSWITCCLTGIQYMDLSVLDKPLSDM